VVISEQAEFDECIFPCLSKYKTSSPVALASPDSVPLLSAATPYMVLDLGEIVRKMTAQLHLYHML
jgi:hypothetical protein